MERFHIWYTYKSGLGVELVRLAPLLRRTAQNYAVCVSSFHAFMYDIGFNTRILTEESEPTSEGQDGDRGVCFYCDSREDGPFSWHSMMIEARRRGWACVNEDLGAPGLNVYDAADRLAQLLVPHLPDEQSVNLLRRPPRHYDHYVLNIFGGAAPEKGFTDASSVRSLVHLLSKATPGLRWVVPALPHQHLASVVEDASAPNVTVKRFRYSDQTLTELFFCSAVVTVEGGGMHVAVAHHVPTLLVGSHAWISATKSLQPPTGLDGQLIGDMTAPDQTLLANNIASWARQHRLGIRQQRATV